MTIAALPPLGDVNSLGSLPANVTASVSLSGSQVSPPSLPESVLNPAFL